MIQKAAKLANREEREPNPGIMVTGKQVIPDDGVKEDHGQVSHYSGVERRTV